MQKVLNKIIIIIFFLITACQSGWEDIKKGFIVVTGIIGGTKKGLYKLDVVGKNGVTGLKCVGKNGKHIGGIVMGVVEAVVVAVSSSSSSFFFS